MNEKTFLPLAALILGAVIFLFAAPGLCLNLTVASKSYNQTIDGTEYLTAEVLLNGQTVLSFHSTSDEPKAAARAEQVAQNINALLAKNADWDNVAAGWAGGRYRVRIGDQEVFTLLIPDSYFQRTPCKDLAADYLGSIKKIVAEAKSAEKKSAFPAAAILTWLGQNAQPITVSILGLVVLASFLSFLFYLRHQAKIIKELSLAIDQLERRIPQMTAPRGTLPALNPEERRLSRYHQVLQLLKEGLSPVEISRKSGIGKGEIELICSLYEKQKNLPSEQKQAQIQ